MSAAATTTRRAKVGRPTAPAPTMAAALTDQQQDRAWLEALCTALKAAADADCPHLHSGESDRLLSAAFDLATLISDPEGDLQPADRDACHTVAAMVKAALQVPGDCPTPERLAFVEQARAPLIGLTEDPAVLDGWETYPRAPAVAATPSPARPRDWLPDVEAKAREAAAVLRSLAEDSGTEEIWGLLRLVQWLTEQVQTRVEDAQASKTPFADSSANIACVLSILNLVAEHDDHVLIHAAGSILNVASSFCDQAMEAGHA